MSDQPNAMRGAHGLSGAEGDVIDYDLLCETCGSNLRTLSLSGRCPECGAPVADSWTPPLLWADKEWLGRIRRGMSLILLTLLLAVVFWFVTMIASIAVFATSAVAAGQPGTTVQMFEMPAWFLVLTWAPSIGLFILGAYALFKATAPEPGHTTDQPDPPARWWCRRLLTAWIVISVLLMPVWMYTWGINPNAIYESSTLFIASMMMGLVGGLVMLIVWVCLMLCWRTLAVRAADGSLAGQTRAVVWCIGICLGLVMVMQVVSAAVNPVFSASGALATGPGGTATMPASMPITPTMGTSMIVMMVAGCFTALLMLGLLGFGIWWVILVFRYRNLLQRVIEATEGDAVTPHAAG